MQNISEMETIYVVSLHELDANHVAQALATHQLPLQKSFETYHENHDDKISYIELTTPRAANLTFAYATRMIFVYDGSTSLEAANASLSQIQWQNPSLRITVLKLDADVAPITADEINQIDQKRVCLSAILPFKPLIKLLDHVQASRKESIKARLLHDKLYTEYLPKIDHLRKTTFLGIGDIVSRMGSYAASKPSTNDFKNNKIYIQTDLKKLQWSLSSLSNSLINSALIPLCIAGVAGAAGYALSLGLFTMLAIAAALVVCTVMTLALTGQLRANKELRGGPLAFFAFGHKQVAQASFHVAEKLAIMDEKAFNPSM